MSLIPQKLVNIRLCLQAMELKEYGISSPLEIPLILVKEKGSEKIIEYNPYENAQQAVQLMDKFKLYARWTDGVQWLVQSPRVAEASIYAITIQEAIVNCTAEYQRRVNLAVPPPQQPQVQPASRGWTGARQGGLR